MKKAFLVYLSIFISITFFSNPSFSAVQPTEHGKATRTKVLKSYGKLPLSFIENKGQMDRVVSYYLKGRQGNICFTKEGMVYDLLSGRLSRSKATEPKKVKRLSFTMKPIGANKGVRLFAKDKLPGKVNYLIGNDPKKWQTDIPIYKEIVYKGLYKGIDLKIYGSNNQMEYDFLVSPGADPGDIRMAFDGIDGLCVDERGDLIIKTSLSDLRHLNPLIYQDIDGRRHIVEGSFRVAKNTVSFDIKDYDKNQPLVIDPLTLSYSTYLGGSSDDETWGIAVDTSGNAYVTGITYSTNFDIQTPLDGYETLHGVTDAFVTKLEPSGNKLSYSTYLGGSGWDEASGIAVDTSGNAYVTGYTESTDFPTQNPFQGTSGGNSDAFVTKLEPNGDTLSYSTYLGGSDDDAVWGIAVDTSGNAYVTGDTSSTDFPTQSAFQGTSGGGADVFIAKIVITHRSGSGGASCFIATAAFGSPVEPHVKVLREFRDHTLLTNRVGRAFVDLYYTYSPPLADIIAKHDSLRMIVRWSLIPIVAVSWTTLQIGAWETLALSVLLLALMSTAAVVVLKRMRFKCRI